MRLIVLAVLLALGACNAPTASKKSEDSAVQMLQDEREIRRVANELDVAVDAKNWEAARALFTDEVNADFTTLGATKSGSTSADTLIENWRRNLHANKTSTRSRSSEIITINGDSATMVSQGHVRYELPQRTNLNVWEGWGEFDHSFVRTPQGWRINGLKFTLRREQGEVSVRNEVAPAEEE